MRTIIRRLPGNLWATFALTIGLLGGAVGFAAVPADASACVASTPVASCSMTGTLTLTAGSLQITPPATLSWSGTQSGLNLSLVDTTAVDQGYTVSDLSGTAAGWHVTVAATTFTNGSHTLTNTGSFSTNGSLSSITASTAPTAACVNAGQCTLPTNTTTYPVAITTAASAPTPVNIYDTSASTGIGAIAIGGSAATNPVGWWLSVPATAYAGTYTSTITIAVVSGP